MRTSIALLPTLVVGIVVAAGPSFAQGWSGSTPVYESDARRAAEQAEAERAARRASYGPVVYPKHMDGGERPDIKPAEPPIVYFDQNEDVGSIIIDTQGRKLYYVLAGKRAYEYPISVGRDGFTWSGTERISRIAVWPSWTPPAEMHKRQPGLPITVTGGSRIRRARARSILATPSIASTAPTMTAPWTRELVRLLPLGERARRPPCLDREGRDKGEGHPELRGRSQRERTAIIPRPGFPAASA